MDACGEGFVVIDGRCQYADASRMKKASLKLWGISSAFVSALLIAAILVYLCVKRQLQKSVQRKQMGVIYL